MSSVERRDAGCYTAIGRPTVRKTATGTRVEGYGAVFYNGSAGSEFEVRENVFERIDRQAFTKTLASKRDVVSCFNHNFDWLLARTSSGTLQLSVDSRGLFYSFPIDLTDPQHQAVVAKMRRGDLCGSSFMFTGAKDEIKRDGSRYLRLVKELVLHELGPVSHPAYDATTAGVSGEGGRYKARTALDDFYDEQARKTQKLYDVLERDKREKQYKYYEAQMVRDRLAYINSCK